MAPRSQVRPSAKRHQASNRRLTSGAEICHLGQELDKIWKTILGKRQSKIEGFLLLSSNLPVCEGVIEEANGWTD